MIFEKFISSPTFIKSSFCFISSPIYLICWYSLTFFKILILLSLSSSTSSFGIIAVEFSGIFAPVMIFIQESFSNNLSLLSPAKIVSIIFNSLFLSS